MTASEVKCSAAAKEIEGMADTVDNCTGGDRNLVDFLI